MSVLMEMSRVSDRAKVSFTDPELRAEIAKMREVDNTTNLFWLGLEYLTLAVIAGLAVGFAEGRESLNLAWAWNIPVFGLAIALVGGVQHRLAGLGHEASHYSFLRNKLANDLVADLLCMFPIMTNVHFYRLFHMAHHQFTNDPEHDPDLINLGKGKRVDEFPMTREKFIATVYFIFITAPVTFTRYQLEYVYVNVFGKGGNVYMKRVPEGDAHYALPRLGTSLGLAYVLGFMVVQLYLTRTGRTDLLIPAGVGAFSLAAVVIRLLPDWAMFHSPFRQPYSERVAGLLRLGFFTALFVALGFLRVATAGKSAIYFNLLWTLPLISSFPFYMLLRDTYQHTNADDGRLTNTRVFFTDPFTRWAVFVYGQDMHVPHHLFPAVPHYRLPDLHELLKCRHGQYSQEVVECHGTFANDDGLPTILDVMTEKK